VPNRKYKISEAPCIALLRKSAMFIPDPESEVFHPGFQIKKAPDSRFRIRNKEFYSKNCSLALGNVIGDVHPGSRIWIPDMDFFSILDPGSRGQKSTGSRIRIHNSDINEQLFLLAEDPYPQINSSPYFTVDIQHNGLLKSGPVPDPNLEKKVVYVLPHGFKIRIRISTVQINHDPQHLNTELPVPKQSYLGVELFGRHVQL
jgi:hypothetical protein